MMTEPTKQELLLEIQTLQAELAQVQQDTKEEEALIKSNPSIEQLSTQAKQVDKDIAQAQKQFEDALASKAKLEKQQKELSKAIPAEEKKLARSISARDNAQKQAKEALDVLQRTKEELKAANSTIASMDKNIEQLTIKRDAGHRQATPSGLADIKEQLRALKEEMAITTKANKEEKAKTKATISLLKEKNKKQAKTIHRIQGVLTEVKALNLEPEKTKRRAR